MERTDGMEYQLTKIAKNSPSWLWWRCKCCRNYRFNYHSSRNKCTTGSLPACSACWPFRFLQTLGLFQLTHTSPDIHAAKTMDVINAKHSLVHMQNIPCVGLGTRLRLDIMSEQWQDSIYNFATIVSIGFW